MKPIELIPWIGTHLTNLGDWAYIHWQFLTLPFAILVALGILSEVSDAMEANRIKLASKQAERESDL